MRLYIYDCITEEIEGHIDGNSNEECESKAEKYYDSNEYYYSYCHTKETNYYDQCHPTY